MKDLLMERPANPLWLFFFFLTLHFIPVFVIVISVISDPRASLLEIYINIALLKWGAVGSH